MWWFAGNEVKIQKGNHSVEARDAKNRSAKCSQCELMVASCELGSVVSKVWRIQ
jgi:hypothetical protein